MLQQFQTIHYNFSCLKSFRLKNQLLILISLLITFIVFFLVGSNYLHAIFVGSFLSNSSKQIHTINSNTMLKTNLYRYQSYFTTLLDINGNSLIQLHQLYNYVRNQTQMNLQPLNNEFNMNYGGFNRIPKPLSIARGLGPYDISYSFLCYSNKTQLQNTEEEQINLKMQESLQAYGQIFFCGKTSQQSFLYSYIKRDEILMTYPCLQRFDINNYIPEKRSWYIELSRNYHSQNPYQTYNYSITQPYHLFNSPNIGLSMTLPIVDENLNFIGGAATDLVPATLFADVFQQFGQDFSLIYLVSTDGILIMHPYNVTPAQLPLYIYNDTITGFTLEIWETLSNANSSSNCSDFIEPISFKCVYNTYYNKNLIASIKKLDQYNISILVVVSSTEFNKFQEEYNDYLLDNLIWEFEIQVIQQLSLFIAMSFLIMITTKILFYPIEIIIGLTINQIKLQKSKYGMLSNYYTKILSDEIIELYRSCQHFNRFTQQFSFSKTNQCQQIENLTYPKKKKYIFTELIQHYAFQKLKYKVRVLNYNVQFLNIITQALKNIYTK